MPLPDRIIAASVRGTMEVPQIYCGATYLVGQLATKMISNQELTWAGLFNAEITNAQAAHIGRAVNAAHTQHGIDIHFNSDRPVGTTDPERAAGQASLIGLAGLRTITRNTLFSVGVTSVSYAMETAPELAFLFAEDGSQDNLPYLELVAPIMQELCTNEAYTGQRKALQELWDRSAAMLKEKRVLAACQSYRKAIPVLHTTNTSRYHAHLNSMEQKMYRKLKTRIGVWNVRRAMREKTGYLPSPGAIEAFAHNSSFYQGRRAQTPSA